MNIVKRIKWPGWLVLGLLFLFVSMGVYEIVHKQEAVNRKEVELKNLPTMIVNNQGVKRYPAVKTYIETTESDTEQQWDPDGKYVALTFDDGPIPEVTPLILETLKQFNVKATFFMLGKQVDQFPDLAKQVANEGHEIANHSNSHADMTKLDLEGIQQEFGRTNEKIEQATGVKPVLIRPPYGAYDEDVIAYAEKEQCSIILWSVDSLDWKSRDANSIYDVTTKTIANRAIVLMHDIQSATAEALPELLSALGKEGYEFLSVSELLTLQEEKGAGPFYGKVF